MFYKRTLKTLPATILVGLACFSVACFAGVLLGCYQQVKYGAQQPHETASTERDTLLVETTRSVTVTGLGTAQGVEVRDGHIYLFGDAETGVIQEHVLDPTYGSRFTGKILRLTRAGVDLIPHPTGLTFHPSYGTFIGNTVAGRGTLFQIDWKLLLEDRTLDRALLRRIEDDAGHHGTRPEFVRWQGRWLLATADYGDQNNEVRLYDPERLVAGVRKTSAPGVVVARYFSGPWVQSLHWIPDTEQLVAVQNKQAGQDWRLSVYRFLPTGLRQLHRIDHFPQRDELQGFHLLGQDGAVFVTSAESNNVWLGRVSVAAR